MSSTPPPNAANFDPFDNPIPPASPPPREYFTRPPLVIPDRDIDIAKICGPRPLADTNPAGVTWLWPGRVPLGKLTLLVGDPGVGKSLLALDIAARLSSGQAWPDEKVGSVNDEVRSSRNSDLSSSETSPFLLHTSNFPPSSVLILSAEDDPADTIRPRLAAMGADLARVVANPWGRLTDEPQSAHPLSTDGLAPTFDLGRNLRRLAMLLDVMPECRLIILDPLAAFLGRNIENFNAEVRRVLAPLAGLASRRNIAILAVCHLRKAPGSDLHRTLGSLAFMAFARLAWLVARDGSHPDRRILAPIKNNLGPLGSALPFTFDSATPGGPPALVWSPDPLSVPFQDVLHPPKQRAPRPSPELDDAKQWLAQKLSAGVLRHQRILNHAEAAGLTLRTVRRAFRELGGEAVRTGFGLDGQWHWRLPGVGPQQPTHDPLAFLED